MRQKVNELFNQISGHFHKADSKLVFRTREQLIRFTAVSMVFIVSSLLSLFVVKKLEATVFFDKFIFYKKTSYGYWVPGKDLTLKSFGERSKSIAKLHEDWNSVRWGLKEPEKVLGFSVDDSKVTIAVIGDSYTWGQGVKYEDTYPVLLEKELNRRLDTEIEVITLAEAGNSILDYAILYEAAEKLYDVDFYIFGLVLNDIYPTISKVDWELENSTVIQECDEQYPSTDLVVEHFKEEYINDAEAEKRYAMSLLVDGWNSEENYCFLTKSIDILPVDDAIYFAISNYWENDDFWEKYKESLTSRGRNVVSTLEMSLDPIYEKYMSDPEKYLRVSKIEGHPSKLAHRIYSRLLVKKIIAKFGNTIN